MQSTSQRVSTININGILMKSNQFPPEVCQQIEEQQKLNNQQNVEIQSCNETIKSQTEEIDKLVLGNSKKDQQLGKIQVQLDDVQEENRNYHDEILEQTKVLSEKFVQLKNEQKKVTLLQEQVKKFNENTGVKEIQANSNQKEQSKQLDKALAEQKQLKKQCELQLTEIEQLKQVKIESDLLINEYQKASNHFDKRVSLFTKEEVGTPEESEENELEKELEQKDLYIEQLGEQLALQYEQLQEASTSIEKIKFLEDKNKNLKDKLQSLESNSSKIFWDLEITCNNASLLSLMNDKWQFEIKNPDGMGDYYQQVSVFGFDSSVMQQFVDITFNYDKQQDGLYNSMTSQAITHLKAIVPKFLEGTKLSKKQQNSAFLLATKLLSRQHYSKDPVKQMDKQEDDSTALEEFWFKYSLSQTGTVIFVCTKLGLEEIELIRRLSFLQHTLQHQRLLILVITQKELSKEELNLNRQICWELQMTQLQLNQEESITSQRVLMFINLQKNTTTEVQLYLQNVIKKDQIKMKSEFSFVDQIREYIVKTCNDFFENPEDAPADFKIEQPNDDIQGFDLTLLLLEGAKPKLKRSRATNIITSQSVVNSYFKDNGDVHIEVFAPSGEIIKKHKVDTYYIEGQGTKLRTKISTDFGSGDDELLSKYRFLQMFPQWQVTTQNIENLGYKLVIVLQQIPQAQ